MRNLITQLTLLGTMHLIHRFIKLTSPNLSYSMPLGAIFLYAVVIVTGAPLAALAKSFACNVSRVTSCDIACWLMLILCVQCVQMFLSD